MLKFFKDFLIYGLASTLGKLAALFLMPLYTSILTHEEYGAMAMLLSAKGIIDLVSNLNIHSGIARDFYEKGIDRKALVSTGLWSILSLSLSIMMIMIVSRHFWVDHVLNVSGYVTCFIIVLLSIPTGSVQSYFAILTRFKKKPVLFAVGTLLQLAIQIGVSIYSVVVLRIGINGVFLGTLLGEVFGVVYFSIVNREYIGISFKREYLKRALLFALPTLPAIAAGWVDSSFGQMLVGRFVSLDDLGVYSIALQFASVFTLISTALGNVWSPFLYENYKKDGFERQINNLFVVIVTLLIIVSTASSLFSREIILLFSNATYLKAGEYLTLLCIPMAFYVLFPIASSGISISRDTKFIGIAYVTGSVINIVSLFILLPRVGVIVVPICLALSRIVAYCIMFTVTKHKKLYDQLPNWYLLMLVAIIVSCYFLHRLNLSFCWRLLVFTLFSTGLYIVVDKQIKVSDVIKALIHKKQTP